MGVAASDSIDVKNIVGKGEGGWKRLVRGSGKTPGLATTPEVTMLSAKVPVEVTRKWQEVGVVARV